VLASSREREGLPVHDSGGFVDVGDVCNWTQGVVDAGGSDGDAAPHKPGSGTAAKLGLERSSGNGH